GSGLLASCNGSVPNGASIDTSSVGTKSFTVTAADAVGNKTDATVPYRVIFASSGLCYGAPGHAILEPIAQDGSRVFNQLTTVPAKFRVCDAGGNSIGAPGVVSSFKLIQIISGTSVQNVNEEVPSMTQFTAFRWDPLEQQWIFNISTRSYLSGR